MTVYPASIKRFHCETVSGLFTKICSSSKAQKMLNLRNTYKVKYSVSMLLFLTSYLHILQIGCKYHLQYQKLVAHIYLLFSSLGTPTLYLQNLLYSRPVVDEKSRQASDPPKQGFGGMFPSAQLLSVRSVKKTI